MSDTDKTEALPPSIEEAITRLARSSSGISGNSRAFAEDDLRQEIRAALAAQSAPAPGLLASRIDALLSDLDKIGLEVDPYEFGLPLHGKHHARMREAVAEWFAGLPARAQSAPAEPQPAPDGASERDQAPQKGDYVLATKYADGDPGDAWALGFYDCERGGRHYVVDGKGRQIRGNGYRRVGRIRRDVGRWLLETAAKPLETSPPGVMSLWTMLTDQAHDLEEDREAGKKAGKSGAALAREPQAGGPSDEEIVALWREHVGRVSVGIGRHPPAWFGSLVRALAARYGAGAGAQGEAVAWMRPEDGEAIPSARKAKLLAGIYGSEMKGCASMYTVPLYTAPPAQSITDAMVQRMRSAIEGECDGAAIDDFRARAVLEFVLDAPPAQAAEPRKSAYERDMEDTLRQIAGALGLDTTAPDADALIRRAKEAAQAAEAREGWQLVPLEPTSEMKEAAHDAARALDLSDGQPAPLPRDYELWSSAFVYRAMLAAAPKPEDSQR